MNVQSIHLCKDHPFFTALSPGHKTDDHKQMESFSEILNSSIGRFVCSCANITLPLLLYIYNGFYTGYCRVNKFHLASECCLNFALCFYV